MEKLMKVVSGLIIIAGVGMVLMYGVVSSVKARAARASVIENQSQAQQAADEAEHLIAARKYDEYKKKIAQAEAADRAAFVEKIMLVGYRVREHWGYTRGGIVIFFGVLLLGLTRLLGRKAQVIT